MLKKSSLIGWIAGLKHSDESNASFLEKKYLKILKRCYKVLPEAVSNEPSPNLPKFASLLEVQDYTLKWVHDPDPAISETIYNGYWRLLLGDLLEALPRQTGLHDATIFIGEVPDPIFNAEVRDFGRDRYLILIQRGLELFLYRMSLAIIGSIRLRIGLPGAHQIVQEPEIDMDTARSIVSRNIEALFHEKHAMPIILKSETALALSCNYAYAMQQFIIAHEIGHIMQSVRPYLDASGDLKKAPLSTKSYLKHPWNKEIVADFLAANICNGLITTVTSKGYMAQDIAEDVLFEAPYIIFSLLEALDKFAASNGIKPWETHPPADLRKSKLLSAQIAQGVHKDYKQMAEERSKHVGLLTGLI